MRFSASSRINYWLQQDGAEMWFSKPGNNIPAQKCDTVLPTSRPPLNAGQAHAGIRALLRGRPMVTLRCHVAFNYQAWQSLPDRCNAERYRLMGVVAILHGR